MAMLEIDGLDEAMQQIDQLLEDVAELSEETEISMYELMNPSFMRKYTTYASFDELLEAGGFAAKTDEEFDAIPDDLFNAHIANTTKFSSWEEMLDKALEQYDLL